MRYRLTCLTPLLVGDGRKLSPIDYMVWKDHVNVLDQWRIFRLLAKGPRLEGYLSQLKKADKLDFASWGGFAQNFAGRRIPFENAAYSAYWNRAAGDSLHIPTFACGASGPYLPATAIKGALRTGMVFANWRDGMLQDVVARTEGERFPRRPSARRRGASPGRRRRRTACVPGGAGDSAPVATTPVQGLPAAHLHACSRAARASRWAGSTARAGAVDGARPDDSTPTFAEMAVPGTTFEGDWNERTSSCSRKCGARCAGRRASRARFFEAANVYAAGLLTLQRQYATWAGMGLLDHSLDELEQRLAAAREKGSCLLALGWGGGLPAKSAWLDTTNADYRQILKPFGVYDRALASNLPFPKTRRIVFLNNRPATLPGWAELTVE